MLLFAFNSDIDLNATEPQVATKIRQLIQDVERNPSSDQAWGRLAINLDVHDFKKEAIPCYKEAIKLDAREFKWSYFCAIALNEFGASEALTYFAQSSKLKPNYGPAHLRYGQALLDAERIEEALHEFQLAVKYSPGASHPYLGLARIALIKKDYEQCFTYLSAALQKNPNHGEAHGLLAEVYRRKGDLSQAQREQNLALQSSKTPPDDPLLIDWIKEGVSSYWYESRGRAYMQRGEYGIAIKELQAAVKALPDARLYDLLGIAFQYDHRFKDALKQHEAALALQPKSAGTLNNLANALAEQGRVEEAISRINEAIEIEPDFSYSYIQLSSLHRKSGNKREAMDVLERGHQRLPENHFIATRLSWLLSTCSEKELRNGKRALQIAEQSCNEAGESNAECLDVLAAAYAETGDFQKAILVATKAITTAQKEKKMEFARQIQNHLYKYKESKPYHE